MILVINKEKNITSRDVVNNLDPLATGVLVCLTDKHTKLVDVITSEEKEYIAEIKLGIETDTLDITGNIINENNNINLDINNIKNVLKSFVGKYIEEVPKYSAVKINGKKLYQYARNNVDIELPKREVEIKEIELLDYHDDIIKFKCLVSKGTYIRSLIKDIYNKLNVLGTMNSLIRTKQGKFTIDSSYTLDDVKNNNYRDIPIDNVLDVKYIELDDNLYKKVINGNRLNLDYNGYILFTKDNKQVALYNFINKEGKLIILF